MGSFRKKCLTIFDLLFYKDAERFFSLTPIQNFIITSEHLELPDNYDFSTRCSGGKFGAFITEFENKPRLEFSTTQVIAIME